MSDVKEILENLGYELTDRGKEYRARPLYRESNNRTSLSIKKDNGYFFDYSAGISGPIEDLVKLTLKLKDINDAKKWLDEKRLSVSKSKPSKPKIRMQKTYPKEILNKLIQKHDYWLNRHISKEVLLEFKGGLAMSGKLAGRYVMPVFNTEESICGFIGRDIYENDPNRSKWMLHGAKMEWKFPLNLSLKHIKEKNEVILVESVGDCLSLFTAGIRNVLVLFGVELGAQRIISLLKINPKKIIISLNNDKDFGDNNGVGNMAAEGIKKQLLSHFDTEQVEIRLPKKANDWSDTLQKYGKEGVIEEFN